MTGFARDVVQAVRLALRRPVASAIIVLTFALGIGANTALFSVIKAVWIDTVPYRTASRAVQVFVTSGGDFRFGPNMPELTDLRAEANSPFEVTAVVTQAGGGIYRLSDGRPILVRATEPDVFRIFPETPVAGRLFDADDQRQNGDVAVISEAFWQREFGGDPAAIGKSITITGQGGPETLTILGVLPARFATFARGTALLRPIKPSHIRMDRRGHGSETVYALLRPGVSPEQARVWLAQIGERWKVTEPTFQRYTLTTESMRSVIAGANVGLALAALLGVSALVLIMACVNVANLLVAGGEDRKREIAVRASLGAGRWRLARQLLAEALVLACAGGAAAIGMVSLTRDALVNLLPQRLPGLDRIAIDGRVLAFALTITLVCTMAAALWPSLRLSTASATLALASGERAGRRNRASSLLLGVQIAIGVVVVVSGLLLLRSFARLSHVDPGFETENVLLVSTSMRERQTNTQALDLLLERLRAIPGVEVAGAVETVPLGGGRVSYGLRPLGADPSASKMIDYRRISPGYLRAMRIPVIKGRDFLDTDRRGSELVALLNESGAATLYPGGDALGQRINAGSGGIVRIVGIVGDIKFFGLDRDAVPEIFRPLAQENASGNTVAVRYRPGVPGVAAALRALAEERPSGYDLRDVRPAGEHVGRSLREPWFRTVLFGLMATLVLVLTVIGVAGLVTHAVVRRQREMGIRMAIGARPSQAVGLLVRQAMVPSTAGAALGLVAAWWATRAIGHFLFAIEPRDLPSFAAAGALMLGCAAIAAWLPARRAARIDPAIALRID
ncbi:MAG: ADOP family duplicated permease [Vicinamibacterales bacterium]